jgi:Leucine-rich repeat (LRR) protein
MTLINSCYPKSFLHLIFLFSTCVITATTIPEKQQLDANSDGTTGHQRHHQPLNVLTTTSIRSYDRTISDNNKKKFDETIFEFKTDDINKLLYHLKSQTSLVLKRRRRDAAIQITTTKEPTTTITSQSTTVTSIRKKKVEDEHEKVSENLILNLSFGNLTNFHVNFTNTISDRIEAVNLSHNALLNFNSSKLTKLKVLDVSHNKLNGNFSLVGCEFLQTLDLSFNSLSSFSCVGCGNLVSLNLSDNALINISLIASSEHELPLQILDLSSNELTDIDSHLFDNKSNLTELILACNRMRIINKDLFRQLRSLRRLDLSFNDISIIENEALAGLDNLQILDLSHNRLLITSLEALRALADLARLSLAGNMMLRNALRGFAVTWSILELDYSHVGLCQVPDSLAQSVRILNLYGNSLNVSRFSI